MAKIYMELNQDFEQAQERIRENIKKADELAKDVLQGQGQEPQPAQSQGFEEEEEPSFGLSMDELFGKGGKKLAEEAGEELALGAIKEALDKFVDVSIEGSVATITMPVIMLEMVAEIFQGLEKGAER